MMSIRLSVTESVHALKSHVYLSKRLKSTHVYRKVIPWKHSKDLADYLVQNVIYNKFGIVVLNKPSGVGSSKNPGAKQYTNAAPVGDQVFSLYDSIPYIAKSLGYENLFLASVPERYTSGVTILTTNKYACPGIKRGIRCSNLNVDTRNLYLAVVMGSSLQTSDSKRVGVKMSPLFPNQPIVVPYTRASASKQKIEPFIVSYGVLSSAPSTSLLQFRTAKIPLNALRVFCTDVLVSPILGDNMFGARVKNVFGKNTLATLTKKTTEQPMRLKPEILEALELSGGQELIVPLHAHLQEVHIANFRKKTIILRAPPPPVFQWSCEKLGLKIPPCGPCEETVWIPRTIKQQTDEPEEVLKEMFQ